MHWLWLAVVILPHDVNGSNATSPSSRMHHMYAMSIKLGVSCKQHFYVTPFDHNSLPLIKDTWLSPSVSLSSKEHCMALFALGLKKVEMLRHRQKLQYNIWPVTWLCMMHQGPWPNVAQAVRTTLCSPEKLEEDRRLPIAWWLWTSENTCYRLIRVIQIGNIAHRIGHLEIDIQVIYFVEVNILINILPDLKKELECQITNYPSLEADDCIAIIKMGIRNINPTKW